MAITHSIRHWVNEHLSRVNLRVDTLTRDRMELTRLQRLVSEKLFEQPAFPVPESMRNAAYRPIFDEVDRHAARFRDFRSGASNPVSYTFDNNYYSSPDAEVLYACVRAFKPARIVEVGCGNSTKISRMAIQDGALDTHIVCIDPHPREDIRAYCDEAITLRAESPEAARVLGQIKSGELLFIDSSHEVKVGNDVVALFLNVIPALPPGVLIHVHDIFLPYEYPADWVIEHKLDLAEQYLLQALLMQSERFEVLWPGYYLQHTLADFASHFEHIGKRRAQSFWLRTR